MTKRMLSLLLSLLFLPALALAGDAAPEAETPNFFAMIDAVDIYGQPFDAAVFTKGLTLVNVWATWCGPCVREIPALGALGKEFEGKLAFVGICYDARDEQGNVDDDAIAGAKALWESGDVRFPSIVPDDMSLALISALNMQYFPTTYFVNGQGMVIAEFIGSRSEEEWRDVIQQVLDYVAQGA